MQLQEEPPRQATENILPLVNIIFLLLIFFMLSGTFSKPDLYAIDELVADSDRDADKTTLIVLMSAKGKLAIDKRQLNDNELKNLIQEKIKHNQQLKLQLKADANVPATRLLDIMDLLGDTGLESINLLTVSQRQKKN